MMKKFKHKFADIIPENIEPGVLYISTEYKTVAHVCPCGCGSEVVTPLSPHDWKLMFDGENVSLYPSIGSWGLPCQSHYWITDNVVEWAPKWTRDQIDRGRKEDSKNKEIYYKKKKRWSPFDFFKN